MVIWAHQAVRARPRACCKGAGGLDHRDRRLIPLVRKVAPNVMLLSPIFYILQLLLQLYLYVILARVILNLLFAFEIVPYRNPVARGLDEFCEALTEPLLRRIPRRFRLIRGIDLGPMILMILVILVQMYLGVFQAYIGA